MTDNDSPQKTGRPIPYSGTGTAIGAALGLIFGLMLDNLTLGVLGGAAIGLVVGAIVDAQGRR